MTREFARVWSEFETLRTEMANGFKAVRSETANELEAVRTEMAEGFRLGNGTLN